MLYAQGLEHFIERCNAAMPPDFYRHPLTEQRALYESLVEVFHYEVPAGVVVADHRAEYEGRAIRVRSYRPPTRSGDGVIVYIRGGGFVVGSLHTHDTVAAELADKTRLLTVAVDFRMSPEHPFPAALEDCYAALNLLLQDRFDNVADFDHDTVLVVGDSSGANMAVTVAMMCRDRRGPKVRGMGLISPVLDLTRWRHGGEDAPLLTGGEMEYYTACYCPEPEQAWHPYVSPILTGTFDRLPAAYIMGAELDSLQVDGIQLAERLTEHGVPVQHIVEPGLVHSAVRARGYSPAVADAWQRFCSAVADIAGARLPADV
jgi:acetyl esterase